MIYRIGRMTRTFIIVSVLFAALALTAIRLLMPQVKAYRNELEAKVGEALGAPVRIGNLHAHIAGFRPELVLADISVAATAGPAPAIQLQEIRLGVDLLESIMTRRFLSAMHVTLVGAKLGVFRKADGSIAVTGFKGEGDAPLWLLQGRHYEVLQSEVVWHDEKDAAPPQTFRDVDIFIENYHAEKRRLIHVFLDLPKDLGQSLRLSMDASGNIFAPGGINGRLYVEGKQVNLSNLFAGHTPEGLTVTAGAADLKLWSDWHKSRMTILLGQLRATQVKLLGAENEILDINTLGANFRWLREAESWQLQVKNLQIDAGNLQWHNEAFRLSAVVGGVDEGVQQIAALFPRLHIADLTRLALFSRQLKAPLAHSLQRFKPSGTLQNVSLLVEPEKQHYSFRGNFAQLGWSAWDNVPAVQRLTGFIEGNEQGGRVRLASRNGQIDFPRLFREAMPISRLSGMLQWRQMPDMWELSGAMLELDTPDIETKNRLLLQIPKGSEPVFIDLQTAFGNVKDIGQAKKYLPSKIMDGEVVGWLDHALITGTVPEGAALLRGNLKDYPFNAHEGVFEVLFTAYGGELHVHPEWPHIKNITADVRFLQSELQADIHGGESEGLQIGQATASIVSLQNSNHVVLNGKVGGDLQNASAYLQKTPLRDTINPVLEFMKAKGASDADLNLQIPLSEKASAKVNGILHFSNAELSVLPLQLPVQGVKGDLLFNEQGVSARGIKAKALGSKVAADIVQSGEQTVVRLDGSIAVDNLASTLPSPYWSAAHGQAAYQLRLAFPGIGQQPASLDLTSNLQGLALDLPGTLQKKAGQPRSLSIEFGFPEGVLLPMAVNYSNELRASVYIDKQSKSLYSADVLLTQQGSNDATVLSAQPGVTIGVKRQDFAIDPWLQATSQAGDLSSKADVLRALTIKTQHLRWQGNDLGESNIELQKREGRWQGAIISSFAAGNISLPQHFSHTEKLVLDLQMLNLSPLADLHSQGEAPSPLNWPGLQINSHKVLWRSVNLGALNLRAEPTVNGLDFSEVVLHAPDKNLQLAGRWQASGKHSFSEAKGWLHCDALGNLLAQLDIVQDMQETAGKIDFTLHWNGAPYQVNFANLQGIVSADFEEGRMLGVNPGIGRVLGILALDQWKRRLQLDFSDAYAEGLTYNRIKGRFELVDGYALTDDLTIEAVPAKIEIKGKTGLVAHDWDQLVIVTPKTSAALPIAGTIAGKLITGAASLVAEESFVEELKHFASAAYAVKGKWGAAEITPLPESDGVLRKVWTGMTDFSWLK